MAKNKKKLTKKITSTRFYGTSEPESPNKCVLNKVVKLYYQKLLSCIFSCLGNWFSFVCLNPLSFFIQIKPRRKVCHFVRSSWVSHATTFNHIECNLARSLFSSSLLSFITAIKAVFYAVPLFISPT